MTHHPSSVMWIPELTEQPSDRVSGTCLTLALLYPLFIKTEDLTIEAGYSVKRVAWEKKVSHIYSPCFPLHHSYSKLLTFFFFFRITLTPSTETIMLTFFFLMFLALNSYCKREENKEAQSDDISVSKHPLANL